jgi:glycosyltransferase involved in cell wall biosynthesis
MRIAITADPFIPVPPIQYGGIERIIFLLINELQILGHQVVLYAHADSKVSCMLRPYPGRENNFYNNFRNFLLVSEIASGKFDLVHSFGRLAYLTLLLPLRVPKIMSYQREPSIRTIKVALKLASKNSLTFTGCSDYVSACIRKQAPCTTVHNGVDVNKYTFQETVGSEAPLVFLGRIERIKGTHLAIEVAKATGKKLLIAGNIPDDRESNKYFSQAVEPHIDGDQITYAGPVNDEQKNKLLGQALAFLMPIVWDEPFGIVMAEALACGTPVIAFERGSVPEVVADGKNGFICRDILEMIGSVDRIREIDRSACRRTAEEKFSAPVLANHYEALYKKIAGETNTSSAL